jgi:uncharacterized protein YcbX
MVTYVPTLEDPTRPRQSAVRVRLPDGRELPVTSLDLLADLSARYPRSPIHLMHLSRGAVDAENISLISTATVHAIGDTIGEDLDPRRFRPNLVVELLPGAGTTTEDDWLGMTLRFGDRPDSARVRIRRKDTRCMMINLEPTTGKQTPAVLRTVVRTRGECAGIYGAVIALGNVEVGDTIFLSRESDA